MILADYPIPKYRFMIGEVLQLTGDKSQRVALVELKSKREAMWSPKIKLQVPLVYVGVIYKKELMAS